ncbi:MAG: hypothetical protein H0T60_12770 [Acidobacteria bacterium]|nr:hypothetical protein [Acidobacteriota bacterium]
MRAIDEYHAELCEAIQRRGKDDTLSKEELEILRDTLKFLDDECERIWLRRALDRLARFRNMFLELDITTIKPTNELTLVRIRWEIEGVRDAIAGDLYESTFVYVPKEKRKYCDKPDLFGRLVIDQFPDAKDDIVEAGNCYAVGAHTACVFHLMRVLEHGLRALAKGLRISFKTKKGTTIPLDLQEWGTIIDKIESKVEEMKNLPKSRQKSKDLQFFSEAVKEFRYFKDGWRNHVMHAQVSYDVYDAAKVMEHVGGFMAHISDRLRG